MTVVKENSPDPALSEDSECTLLRDDDLEDGTVSLASWKTKMGQNLVSGKPAIGRDMISVFPVYPLRTRSAFLSEQRFDDT